MNTELLLPVLGELLAKGTAVLLVTMVVLRSWRGASAAQRHFIWLAAMMTLLLLPMTRLLTPWWKVSLERPAKPSVQTLTLPMESISIAPAATEPISPGPRATVWHLPDWRILVASAWAAGALGLLGSRLLGSWRLRRLETSSAALSDPRMIEAAQAVFAELAIRRAVRVCISSECRVAMTWGIRWPVLVLPMEARSWSDSRLAAALRHEAGHIARGDYLARWVAHLACALYWPNPLVWLAARSLRVAQEQATDDLVLSAGTPPEEYAAQLFDAARTVAAHGLFARHAVAMATPSTLENRVLAIVDEQRDRRPLTRAVVALGATAIVLSLAVCTAAQLRAAEPTTPPVPANAAAGGQQVQIMAKFVEITAEPAPGIQEIFSAENAVYTDPQFQVIVRALNQMKGTDLLSSPSVVMKSGQSGTIDVVREFRSASDWEKDAKDVWEPKAFETKEVGVTLEVKPTVNADGTIDLQLNASAVDFLGFTDLDHPKINPGNAEAPKTAAELAVEKGKRLKANFSERRLGANVTLNSGETVALGGVKGENPPDKNGRRRKLVVFVSAFVIEPPPKSEKEAAAAAPPKELTQEWADKFVIPKLDFREATVKEAVDFLRAKCRVLSEGGKEVNFVVNIPPDDQARITVSLTDIPLLEAVKYVTQLANLPLRIEPWTILIGNVQKPQEVVAPAEGPKSAAWERALKITIPKLEFREATVEEAVGFIRKKALELDPDHRGVNFVLKQSPASEDAKISLSLTNVPMTEALRYVASLANLELVADPEALVLRPPEKKPAVDAFAAPPGAAAPVPAPPGPPKAAGKDGELPLNITADSTKMEGGIAIAEGHARLTCGATTIKGDSVRYDLKSREMDIVGHAEIDQGDHLISGDRLQVVLDLTGKISVRGQHKITIKPDPAGAIPEGAWVPGKPGFVISPHAPEKGMIDVRGFPPGTQVKCPYSRMIFRVPELPAEEKAGETAPAVKPAVIQEAPKESRIEGRAGLQVGRASAAPVRAPGELAGGGAAVGGIAPAAPTLELQPIRVVAKPDAAVAKHLTLEIPIDSRPKSKPDVKDIVVKVLFFDKMDGKVVRTTADVSAAWKASPADWADGSEELDVEYKLPKSAAGATFHGYVVRLYYRGKLQGATAEPKDLLDLE